MTPPTPRPDHGLCYCYDCVSIRNATDLRGYAPPNDPGASIRTRITEQYSHLIECLLAGEKLSAHDHAREIIELIREHPTPAQCR